MVKQLHEKAPKFLLLIHITWKVASICGIILSTNFFHWMTKTIFCSLGSCKASKSNNCSRKVKQRWIMEWMKTTRYFLNLQKIPRLHNLHFNIVQMWHTITLIVIIRSKVQYKIYIHRNWCNFFANVFSRNIS